VATRKATTSSVSKDRPGYHQDLGDGILLRLVAGDGTDVFNYDPSGALYLHTSVEERASLNSEGQAAMEAATQALASQGVVELGRGWCTESCRPDVQPYALKGQVEPVANLRVSPALYIVPASSSCRTSCTKTHRR
jgi:hypothetical protein